MYIVSKNTVNEHINKDLSLRSLLKDFLNAKEHDISIRPLSEQLGISESRLNNFIKGKGDIDMKQALLIKELFNLSEKELISAYNYDMNISNLDITREISYVYRNFDINTLRKIGIIKKSKMNEYADQLCNFFGFNTIYEYETIKIGGSMFSKSRINVTEVKEKKMVEFWLKCSQLFFTKTKNPFEYDRELVIEFLKRAKEYTLDIEHGLEKVVLILFRLGVTVLVQEYVANTTSFGVSMIIDNKPCIVITDMNKQYHKLWMNLFHELYHILNDWDILDKVNYHISDRNEPELLFNEEQADEFSRNILINPSIQKELHKIISMRYKVNTLASKLSIDPSIVYGVYLEGLQNGAKKKREYSRYNSGFLKSSEATVKRIIFNPTANKSLVDAIEKLKNSVYKISI